MKIFVDTNVLLDTILPRKDRTFTENSALFLELRHTKEYELCVSTISLATIAFYLKEKQDSIKRMKTLMKGITILGTLASDFSTALQSGQPDIEDAMQFSVAATNKCDLIATRDKTGFLKSPIKFMTPEEILLQIY